MIVLFIFQLYTNFWGFQVQTVHFYQSFEVKKLAGLGATLNESAHVAADQVFQAGEVFSQISWTMAVTWQRNTDSQGSCNMKTKGNFKRRWVDFFDVRTFPAKKSILNIDDLSIEVKHSSHRSLSDVSRPWRGRIQSNVRHRRWGPVVEIAGRLAIQNGRLKMFEEMVFCFTSFLVFWIDTNKKEQHEPFFRNQLGVTGKVFVVI